MLNKGSLHMSYYKRFNRLVFFKKDIQQYLAYMDFHQLYLLLVEALEQLKTMGIGDSTITFSQTLERTQTLVGIKDHCNTPPEKMNAYNAEYNELCDIQGANYNHVARLKWLENQLAEHNVNLELATNEEMLNIIVALCIKMDVLKAEKIAVETQTEEQCAATYAQKQEDCEQHDAERKLREEQPATMYAQKQDKHKQHDAKHKLQEEQCAAAKQEESKQCNAERGPMKKYCGIITWTAERDAKITRMIKDGYTYDMIVSEFGNSIKMNGIANRWIQHLIKQLTSSSPRYHHVYTVKLLGLRRWMHESHA